MTTQRGMGGLASASADGEAMRLGTTTPSTTLTARSDR